MENDEVIRDLQKSIGQLMRTGRAQSLERAWSRSWNVTYVVEIGPMFTNIFGDLIPFRYSDISVR